MHREWTVEADHLTQICHTEDEAHHVAEALAREHPGTRYRVFQLDRTGIGECTAGLAPVSWAPVEDPPSGGTPR